MKILVTGGSGFIGSAVCRHYINETDHEVVNFDALTYAANPRSCRALEASPRYAFVHGDIRDAAAVDAALETHRPDGVMHLAAESHVDRAIAAPAAFMTTNILGTYTLLESVRGYVARLEDRRRLAFRFHHVSTDEVYGSRDDGGFSAEEHPYHPNSPYSASKAASDHLVRAWRATFGVPTVLTTGSNNYGPRQFPEKLIPLVLLNALAEKPLPLYGDGLQVRDWLYVEDHARALALVFARGRVGERYNIGGGALMTNVAAVGEVCRALDDMRPRPGGGRYSDLIAFVADRPGHDRRYAMDTGKIARELGWRPREPFAAGIRKTVAWYLENRDWWRATRPGPLRDRRGPGGE